MRDVRYGTIEKKKMERDLLAARASASASASAPLAASAPRRAPNHSNPIRARPQNSARLKKQLLTFSKASRLPWPLTVPVDFSTKKRGKVQALIPKITGKSTLFESKV